MSIKENLHRIKSSLPDDVTLVAVSKTKPVTDLIEAYEAGQRIFGENYVQELVDKYEQLPKDIQWHFIGHLQSNKVKYIASFVHLIHGVDSIKLLQEINKQAAKHNRIIECLLQLNIAEEDTKFGMDIETLNAVLEASESMKNVSIIGLMGMSTFTNDSQQIKKEFEYIHHIFDRYAAINPKLKVLSIGMSGDYKLAITSGSTMVRIGSSIFGSR
jgi:pyridoxal phosphate enzyme (YggS family)